MRLHIGHGEVANLTIRTFSLRPTIFFRVLGKVTEGRSNTDGLSLKSKSFSPRFSQPGDSEFGCEMKKHVLFVHAE
jgi:hypothetical protein